MEIEYHTESQMRNESSILQGNYEEKKRDIESKKKQGGFPVRFEDQYLHKYLYKGLIYKLIVK